MELDTLRNRFFRIVGTNTESKIWAYIFSQHSLNFKAQEVIKGSNISNKKGYKILKYFLEQNYLVKTEQKKNIQYYNFNIEKEEVKHLHSLFFHIDKTTEGAI